MQANIDVQDRVMRVLQCRSHLCDIPVPGAVFQPHAPDPTVYDTTQGEHRRRNVKRGGEAKKSAGKAEIEGGATDNASVNGYRGDEERGGQVG